MRTIIRVNVFFLLSIRIGFAQIQDTTISDNKVYTYVGEWPEFPGGIQDKNSFLTKHLVYPKEADCQGIQGRVIVGFTVEKDGTISNIKIIKGVYCFLDEEALRVIRLMPKWKPGRNNGVAVSTKHRMDIVFKLRPGSYVQSISCDSSRFTDGSYPTYGNGTHFAFQQAAKEILNYPDASFEKKHGVVSIGFTITKDNELQDITIITSTDPMLEEDALNVIRKLRGNWKAGLKNGKPVDVPYQADFHF